MARIMIIEPHGSGHRLQYPRRISRELIARGHSVQFAILPSSTSNQLFKSMQEEFKNNFDIFYLPEDSSWMAQVRSHRYMTQNVGHYFLFKQFYRSLPEKDRPDHIYLASLEYCMNMIALFGSPFGKTPFDGLAMDIDFMGIGAKNTKWSWLKKQLFLKVLTNKQLRTVFTIVQPVYEYVTQTYPTHASKLVYVADPVELKERLICKGARDQLGIGHQKHVLLVYGGLLKRKGIEYLFKACQEKDFPYDTIILIVCKQYPEMSNCMSGPIARNLRKQGRLIEINKFVTDEEELLAFSAADVVWMGYKDFYRSSGVLYLAASMGLPVIACREGIIGSETARHNIGIVVDIKKPSQITQALNKILKDEQSRRNFSQNGRKLAQKHSSSVFSKKVCDTIESNISNIQQETMVLKLCE